MKHSLFWAAVEAGAKAGRTGFHAARAGFDAVGALVDCGIPRQHAGEQWLTAAEEEMDAWEPHEKDGDCCTFHEPAYFDVEAETYADCDYTPLPRVYKKCSECNQDMILQHYCEPPTPAVSATDSAVEDPSVGVPPAPTEADSLTHLAQCLRDAVGDHYDFACRPYDQFPFWHDDHLIDAFDWEGATTAFLEDVVRQLIDEK